MKNKKVLVAMSGGVDSSVCASLLLDKGYDVVGVTMELSPELEEGESVSKKSCSLSAVDDAKKVAEFLNIPHEVWNYKDLFKEQVIDKFISEYIGGRTPNPCVICNEKLKFGALLERAIDEGYDYVATGHYALIEEKNNRFLLKKAATVQKDQTYALYRLNQHQLSHLMLPVGVLTKDEVRKYAEERKIPVFNKPDSQEICFIRDNDYAGFIERKGFKSEKGNFIDINGNVIGEHLGILHYTIGQRKGLGMTFGKPMFVTEINGENNTVTLGDNKDTFKNSLKATNCKWIAFDELDDNGIECEAKIRYNGPSEQCFVKKTGKNDIEVEFNNEVRAVTPGQSVVFYNGDYVLGGAYIK